MLLGVAARGKTSGAFIGLALASSMRLARTVNYAVRFQEKNLDFLLKDLDFLLKNLDFLLKNLNFLVVYIF